MIALFKILVLVCPAAVPVSECDRSKALDIVSSRPVQSEQQCMFVGQSVLAATAIRPTNGEQYVKVVCVHEHPKEGN